MFWELPSTAVESGKLLPEQRVAMYNPNSKGPIEAATQAHLDQPLHSHDDVLATGPLALECAGLTKRFGPVDAIDGLDLAVHQGQVLALLGPSGCGKTTTLRLIAGFDQPDGGTISIGDSPVFLPGHSTPPEKRQVGMVFQDGALFPHLTVEQNVAFGLPKRLGREDQVREVLDLVDLSTLGHRMPHELSGGQQQRVSLARALAPRPRLLLLDEPFSNLDPGLRQQVRRDTLEILRATGATAIFVTHDQEEALFMGDVLAIMNRGRVEQTGSPEVIFHSPATRFVAQFIGLADFIPAWREEDQLVTDVGSMEWPLSATSPAHLNRNAPDRLEVMVRPDCLHCLPSPEGQGRITAREFQGPFNLYRVSLPSGTSVRCLLPHTAKYSVGTQVAVSVRHGHALRPFMEDQAVAG